MPSFASPGPVVAALALAMAPARDAPDACSGPDFTRRRFHVKTQGRRKDPGLPRTV